MNLKPIRFWYIGMVYEYLINSKIENPITDKPGCAIDCREPWYKRANVVIISASSIDDKKDLHELVYCRECGDPSEVRF